MHRVTERADARGRRRLVLLIASLAAVVAAGSAAVVLLVVAAGGSGRTSAPPWSAPHDVEQRARSAGLTMLTKEGVVMHIHTHLSVTVDRRPVTVPAHIGIDTTAHRYSPIHTHDTSGVLHVESPVRSTFRLGQAFLEWDVALDVGRIGGYHAGSDGVRESVFVDRRPFTGDPTRIVLRERQDIDIVVTTDGSTPVAPAAGYRFPSNY